MTSCCMVYITFSTQKEAEHIAKELLDQRLVAGATLCSDAKSFFWWKEKVQDVPEVLLVAQTQLVHMERIEKLVIQQHSYEIPCIIAMPIVAGNAEFIDWIMFETQEKI